MNVPVMITDNVTELLVKIISFTEVRRKVITGNINNIRTPDFAPRDLDVNEFSLLLNYAIDEHTRNNRLVLCDTNTIKFGQGGSFEVRPMFDKYAKELLDKNPDEYLEHQINKLLENALNQKVAETLLRQKEGITTDFE
jgi:flagellar basal body rod protein FlgB